MFHSNGIRRGAVFALALLALNARSLRAQSGGRAPAAEERPRALSITSRISRVLNRARTNVPSPIDDDGTQIFELGTGAIAPLLEILRNEVVPVADDPVRSSVGERAAALDARQEAIIVCALTKFSRSQLIEPLTQALRSSPPIRLRAACIRMLQVLGDRRDLDLLCRVVAPPEPNGDVDLELAPLFGEAALGIWKREPAAVFAMNGILRDAPSATRLCLMHSLAELGTPEAVSMLGQRLGVQPLEDPFVLNDIAKAAAKVALPIEPSVPEAIRPYLGSENPILAQGAALCLGQLQDSACVVDLIRSLSNPDFGARGAAHRALCAIAGVSLRSDGERWTSWLEGEQAWFAQEAPSRLKELRDGSLGQKVGAIAELSEHPLFRDVIAPELLQAIPQEKSDIQRLALRALGELNAVRAESSLEKWARDPDGGTASVARIALERIRSRRVPPSRVPPGTADRATGD